LSRRDTKKFIISRVRALFLLHTILRYAREYCEEIRGVTTEQEESELKIEAWVERRTEAEMG
jgi:hypothetical protein